MLLEQMSHRQLTYVKVGPSQEANFEVWSKLGQNHLRYCWYGLMLQGQMLLEQMSPRQLTSVKVGLRKLTLKFGQNQVSNSWYIADMDKCCKVKFCLDKCHRDSHEAYIIQKGENLTYNRHSQNKNANCLKLLQMS